MTAESNEAMWQAVRAIVVELREGQITRSMAHQRFRDCGVSSSTIPMLLMYAPATPFRAGPKRAGSSIQRG